MSWWLSANARRIIAVFLLLFDLAQEPGSALSFSGLEDADGDGVAELCTKEDFWWGMPACTENRADAAEKIAASSANSNSGAGPSPTLVTARQRFTPKSRISPIFTAVAITIAAHLPLASEDDVRVSIPREGGWHRNSYVAQKSDIVLIV